MISWGGMGVPDQVVRSRNGHKVILDNYCENNAKILLRILKKKKKKTCNFYIALYSTNKTIFLDGQNCSNLPCPGPVVRYCYFENARVNYSDSVAGRGVPVKNIYLGRGVPNPGSFGSR